MRMKLWAKGTGKRLAILATMLALAIVGFWAACIRMPGRSHVGPLPSLSASQAALAGDLRASVERLCGLGPRCYVAPKALAQASAFVADRLTAAGHKVAREEFTAAGVACANLIAEVRGNDAPDEVVLVGAHYDSTEHGPGADDNASGTAVLLALAQRLGTAPHARTLRLVAFVNEEPPWFRGDQMGSRVHARAARARGDRISAMLSLEMLGCYDDREGSQSYPRPLSLFYPSRGDFVAFVGDQGSRALVYEAITAFRGSVAFPSEGAVLFDALPGVGWSDHQSFWQQGYPAVMVTDTAFFRNPRYHGPDDLPASLDYESMARVTEGLEATIRALLQTGPR